MKRRADSIRRTAAAILIGASIVTGAAILNPSHAVAQRSQVAVHHFPPTTLIPGQGYRLVFANTKADMDSLCRVRAGFVDAAGQLINEGRFALAPGESMTFDLRTPTFEGATMLVRAVLRHEPAGCLSPISEVTVESTGTSCWVVPFTEVEVR